MAAFAAGLSGCDTSSKWPAVVVRLGEGGSERAIGAYPPALIAADEDQATKIGAEILRAGGNAADAAAAVGLALAVTLPSAASLAAGASCLVAGNDVVPASVSVHGDSAPARTPALARGLFALHGRYGRWPWARIAAPAATLARFGQRVSPALAAALPEASALLNDRAALGTFTNARHELLQSGALWTLPQLAETLDRLRAPGPIAAEVARAPASVQWREADASEDGGLRIYALAAGETDDARLTGATAFVVSDGAFAVACAISLGAPFGRGVLADGSLLPSGEAAHAARIALAHGRVAFAAAAAGPDAAASVAAASRPLLSDRASTRLAERAPDGQVAPGGRVALVNVVACETGMSRCEALADPRGFGSAMRVEAKE